MATGTGRVHPDTGVNIPVPVEIGESVLYGKFDGTAIKYNGDDHALIRDDDILFKFAGVNHTVTVEKN